MSLLTNFQDLANTVKLALDRKADKASLSAVATSNDYDDLDNKPTIPDISGKEDSSNKVTSLSSSATDTEYPSAKCVYDELQSIPSMPSGTNAGDILVWNGSAWEAKPKWRMIYQPCEYIESTGTQYIDTGVKAKQTTRIISEEAQTQLSSFSLQGISDANSSFAVFTWGTTSRLQYFESRVGTINTSWAYTNVPIDTQYHKYDMSSGSQKIDNNQYGTSTIPNGYESYRNILLFARYGDAHTVSVPDEFAKVRSKANQIYEGNTLVRDYVPVYNIYTGEAGMYDKANNKFYGNNGSGSFTHGADVN